MFVVPLAIVGWMHPVLAEIAMATSSVTVVSNANTLWRVGVRPAYARKMQMSPASQAHGHSTEATARA